jgi:predicted transcriptional regulator of viral defense system
VLRPRDLADAGLPRDYLWRLYKAGDLERLERGLYAVPGSAFTENRGLAMVARRVPKGVVCLLSALRFHELTTQDPFEVWLAVERGSRVPRGGYPPLRPFVFSKAVFNAGIEEHAIEGATVRVYSPAKTVADCFRYRNKVGLDVALEALRDCWRQRRSTMDEIWDSARVCRVANVIRPYLESLL